MGDRSCLRWSGLLCVDVAVPADVTTMPGRLHFDAALRVEYAAWSCRSQIDPMALAYWCLQRDGPEYSVLNIHLVLSASRYCCIIQACCYCSHMSCRSTVGTTELLSRVSTCSFPKPGTFVAFRCTSKMPLDLFHKLHLFTAIGRLPC